MYFFPTSFSFQQSAMSACHAGDQSRPHLGRVAPAERTEPAPRSATRDGPDATESAPSSTMTSSGVTVTAAAFTTTEVGGLLPLPARAQDLARGATRYEQPRVRVASGLAERPRRLSALLVANYFISRAPRFLRA